MSNLVGCRVKRKNKSEENESEHIHCNPIRLYYLENHSKSQLAITCLEEKNINFEPFEVQKCGITHLLEHDIGTSKVPSIVSCNQTYSGLEEIHNFVKNLR